MLERAGESIRLNEIFLSTAHNKYFDGVVFSYTNGVHSKTTRSFQRLSENDLVNYKFDSTKRIASVSRARALFHDERIGSEHPYSLLVGLKLFDESGKEIYSKCV